MGEGRGDGLRVRPSRRRMGLEKVQRACLDGLRDVQVLATRLLHAEDRMGEMLSLL